MPAAELESYFSVPVSEALYQAAEYNATITDFIYPEEPQLVIETCGWKMPGEEQAEAVQPTTASIYLGVIQK